MNALLTESRAAHTRYRKAANAKVPDYAEAERHVADALAARTQADALDPRHTSSGWAIDTVSHERLMAFYQRYPEIP